MEDFNSFDQYQQLAASTAIYPDQFRLIYPILGLTNEAGEVAGKLKKIMRDEDFSGVLTSEQEEVLAAELGDVLWYLAAVTTDMGLSLGGIAHENIDKLFDRKDRGVLGGSGDNR